MGFPSGRSVVWTLCFAACSAGSAPQYRTAQVVERDLVATIESTGRLRAQGRVDLASPIAGQIVEVGVRAGERVEEGQLLVAVAAEEGEREVARAEAERAAAEGRVRRADVQLAQARNNLARVERLFEQGQRSVEVRESAEAEEQSAGAALAVARAELEAARARLKAARDGSAARLVAPAEGVALRVDAEPGHRVRAGGAPLVVFSAGLKTLQLAASVGESDVARVRPGGAVRFEVPAHPELSFRGVVRSVGLMGTEDQGVVAYEVDVEADNADGRLRPGMSAAVWFEVARAEGAKVVPEAALRYRPADAAESANRDQLHVLRDGELRSVAVERGVSDGAWVAVQGDLQPGEVVVLGVENAGSEGEGGLSLGGKK